jgi:hypothetical protein
VLDPNDAQFGYPLSVAEVNNQLTSHAVDISGLPLGTYECRPASRQNSSDDFSVGDPVQFTLAVPGVIAGVTDSNTDTGFTSGTVPTGAVQGATTDATESDPTETVSEESSAAGDEADSGLEPTVSAFEESLSVLTDSDCLYIWLLLLAAMMFLWSLIDDFIRNRAGEHTRWLLRNTIFAGVFALAVWLLRDTVFLQTFWWLFAAAWVVMTVVDYRLHATDPLWMSAARNVFYAVTSLVLIVSSILFSFPCVWWPFAAIGVVSLVVWVVEKRKE